MFEKLIVQNFQNITKTEILFAPDCTTLVGRTDAGKTARLRALNWLMFNEPAGTSFIRQGQEDCRVILYLDNGHKITREVGPHHNVYRLDGKVFKAFGRNVPDDIVQLLNVGPVNVQDQISLPYFFCLSPGQVSKELNGVINLSVIDRTITASATETRRARGQVEFTTTRLEKTRAECNELSWVKNADAELKQIENLYTRIEEKRSKISSTQSAVEDVSRCRRRLQTLSQAKLDVLPLIEQGVEIIKRRDLVKLVRSLVNSCTQSRQRCQEMLGAVVKVEKELHELSQEACPLCGRSWK